MKSHSKQTKRNVNVRNVSLALSCSSLHCQRYNFGFNQMGYYQSPSSHARSATIRLSSVYYTQGYKRDCVCYLHKYNMQKRNRHTSQLPKWSKVVMIRLTGSIFKLKLDNKRGHILSPAYYATVARQLNETLGDNQSFRKLINKSKQKPFTALSMA